MEPLTSIVKDLCGSLRDQLVYEEEKLFPYADRLIYACRKNEAYGKFILKSLHRSSLEELIPFHAGIVNSLEQLEKITEFYNIPHNA